LEKLIIVGEQKLAGTIHVSGAKNAVLPILAGTLLATDSWTLFEVPELADVETMCELLRYLGMDIRKDGNTITGHLRDEDLHWEANSDFVRKMRASFLILGPLLARFGHAKISLPGGCAIGSRPIDLHLKGLSCLGAKISVGHGCVEATCEKLVGGKVYLDFPSVGATENIMLAGVLAEGYTVIENAAEEPEIVDLANFLNSMGAHISGAGTNIIKIEGVKFLGGTKHTVIPDRIEAGTYMVLAAATHSNLFIDNVIVDHLKPVIHKLLEMGVEIYEEGDGVRVISHHPLEPVDIKTLPYPGFPTDMQAQMMALLTCAKGTSVITETVFENRFMHVDELTRMGGKIIIEGHSAVVKGVPRLTGTQVTATDLRAGAALVIAGLMAHGQTEIRDIHHIHRGYEKLVQKLKKVGALIESKED
jgi:UDP-N-acetylglucosamine 1-carboxyvinyltransferase